MTALGSSWGYQNDLRSNRAEIAQPSHIMPIRLAELGLLERASVFVARDLMVVEELLR
jgi:hypothetical protein